jgi:hypothetical protein
MSRTGYNEFARLPDPVLTFEFDLRIYNLPGGGDTNAVTVKCSSTSLPGISNEPVMIQLRSVDVNRPGKQIYNKSIMISLLETRDMTSRDALNRWIRRARDMAKNTGSYFDEISTTADILLYDATGRTIRTIRLYKVWCTTEDDGQLDSSSAALMINGSLNYDFYEDI